jgi:hypothetical protein
LIICTFGLPTKGNSQQVEVSFCLNEQCVARGIQNYSKEEIEPFAGIVWVEPQQRSHIPSLGVIQIKDKIV